MGSHAGRAAESPPMANLHLAGQYHAPYREIFHKRRHSALVGSGLSIWLIQHGIRRLIVSGIRTEQCCETTTRHASDLGFDVDYVTEATLTFPMTARDGRVVTPAEIRARTELVLADRFARIATVDEALGGMPSRQAA